MTLQEFLATRLGELVRLAVLLCGNEATGERLVDAAVDRTFHDAGDVADPDSAYARLRVWIVRGYLSEGMDLARGPAADIDAPIVDASERNPDWDDLTARFVTSSKLQRAVATLRYVEQLEVPAIAVAMGSTEEGITQYLQRIFTDLGIADGANSEDDLRGLLELYGDDVDPEAGGLAARIAERLPAPEPDLSAETLARFELARLEREAVDRQKALRAERARLAQEESDRAAAVTAERQRLERERAAAQRLAAEQAEAERVAAELAAAERVEAERLEAERRELERLEAERLTAERLTAERLTAERLTAERLSAEQAEAAHVEAEREAAERARHEAADQARRVAEQEERRQAKAERQRAARAARATARQQRAAHARLAREAAERAESERRAAAEQQAAAREALAAEAAATAAAADLDAGTTDTEPLDTDTDGLDDLFTDEPEPEPERTRPRRTRDRPPTGAPPAKPPRTRRTTPPASQFKTSGADRSVRPGAEPLDRAATDAIARTRRRLTVALGGVLLLLTAGTIAVAAWGGTSTQSDTGSTFRTRGLPSPVVSPLPGTKVVAEYSGVGSGTVHGKAYDPGAGRQLAIHLVCSGDAPVDVAGLRLTTCASAGAATTTRSTSFSVHAPARTTWRIAVTDSPDPGTDGALVSPVDPLLTGAKATGDSILAAGSGSGTFTVSTRATTRSTSTSVRILLRCSGSGVRLTSAQRPVNGRYATSCFSGWSYQFDVSGIRLPLAFEIRAAAATTWRIVVLAG